MVARDVASKSGSCHVVIRRVIAQRASPRLVPLRATMGAPHQIKREERASIIPNEIKKSARLAGACHGRRWRALLKLVGKVGQLRKHLERVGVFFGNGSALQKLLKLLVALRAELLFFLNQMKRTQVLK